MMQVMDSLSWPSASGKMLPIQISSLNAALVANILVPLIVTPASQAVYTEAIKAGYIEAIAESGAIVTNSTCGACFGYHMGLLGAGEVCMTASTRNFKGRMGSPDAEIYMASPYSVAAAAIAGHIIDPRKLTA